MLFMQISFCEYGNLALYAISKWTLFLIEDGFIVNIIRWSVVGVFKKIKLTFFFIISCSCFFLSFHRFSDHEFLVVAKYWLPKTNNEFQ